MGRSDRTSAITERLGKLRHLVSRLITGDREVRLPTAWVRARTRERAALNGHGSSPLSDAYFLLPNMKRFAVAVLISTAAEAQVVSDPPIAARIAATTQSSIQTAIEGHDGAVPPNAYVAAVTLESGHVAIVRATASGAFQTQLFAPPGTTVMIKVDRTGTFLRPVVEESRVIDHQLMELPGTIVRVPDPPASDGGTSFGTAGRIGLSDASITWSARGSVAPAQVEPGGQLTIRMSVTAHITTAPAGAPKISASVTLVPLSRADGRAVLTQSTYASTFMTATGLPVERNQWLFGSFQRSLDAALGPSSANELTADLEWSLPLPAELPPGYYTVAMIGRFTDVPPADVTGQVIDFRDRPKRAEPATFLSPIVRVGNPAAPRIRRCWSTTCSTARAGSPQTRTSAISRCLRASL